ncbi:fibronectin type III domain-containing protein [Actinocrispum wychmicini]|nr:fibronectin type III domain-containing protein [Actinocrispum wychmicini]
MRLGLVVGAGLLLFSPNVLAATDTTPPSAPQNFRQIGSFAGRQVLGWDASTDNSGSINHYSVLVNGSQAYRPRTTSVNVDDLVRYCHALPGRTYTIAVQAVDPSGNHSASSAPLQVMVS